MRPQLDALTAGTRLVTLTIGGNDSSTFIGAIVACSSAGIATAGQGSPCKTIYGDSFVNTVKTKTGPAVLKALRDIHATSPNARVAILGYPWILPPADGCFPVMPIASGDVPYLRDLQATLNGVIKSAAAQSGSTYVDFTRFSEGHDACQPVGTRWIEPPIGSLQPVPVHPNALGEQKMAVRTLSVLGLG